MKTKSKDDKIKYDDLYQKISGFLNGQNKQVNESSIDDAVKNVFGDLPRIRKVENKNGKLVKEEITHYVNLKAIKNDENDKSLIIIN